MKSTAPLSFKQTGLWYGLAAVLAALLCPPASAAPRQGPDGNTYEVVLHLGGTLTWEQARAEASVGGSLAAIRSEAVDLFVEGLRQEALTAAGIDPDDIAAPALWIGGSQGGGSAGPGSGWTWQGVGGDIPGSSVDPGYSNWFSGEPNDWPSPVEDGEEDHLAIGFRGEFGWNDRSAPCVGYVAMQNVTHIEKTEGPFLNRENNHLYEFVLSTRGWTWEEAEREARCRTRNGLIGHLASVDSLREAEFIEMFRAGAVAWLGFNPADPASHPPLWIGGRQSATATAVGSGWSWVDGGSVGVGHSDWIPGQPDDAPGTGVEDGEENFLALGRGGGGWSDESGIAVGYVVEYEDPIPTTLQLRSTRYGSASGGYRFNYHPGFTRNVSMAVEAWVYREAGPQFQTILSQGFTNSYWLGFAGDKIRFYRSGGTSADSLVGVPTGQWTHIAISYDGAFVRFYIDGVSAGERSLSNSGTGTADDIFLGRDPGSIPYELYGSLDELRLWSTTRTGAQIRDGMSRELRGVTGLEAVWPSGGQREAIGGADGVVVGNATGKTPGIQRGGILPKELVVPAASQEPTFDGNVDVATEYAGAEQIVLRYSDGPGYKDAIAYLVHTKDYLYLGVEGARLPASGEPSLNNVVSAYLDADGTTTTFDPELMQGRVFLADGLSGYSRVKTVTIGAITTNVWSTTPQPPSYEFQSRNGTQFRDELTGAADMEFRFNRSLLGDFDAAALDRLALSHTDNGGPVGDRWAPEGGDPNSSASWTELRYYPIADPELPLIYTSGRVIDPATGNRLSGVQVDLRGVGVNIASTTTDSSGTFRFDGVAVTKGRRFEIAITPPEDSLLQPANAVGPGMQPASLSPTVAVYDGCTGGACSLAVLIFNITPPLPPTALTTFSPTQVWPPVLVRGGADPRRVVPSTVRVEGSNLHPLLDFFFARTSCPNDLSLPTCTSGIDYFPASATFFPAAADGSDVAHYLVEVPDIPVTRYGFMRLAAHDRWDRPGNVVLSSSSWRNAPTSISVGPPPYELIHGFHFRNIEDGHDVDDYRAAFYDQVCDPRYMVGFWAFSPVYLSILGNGECVGLAVTAQQLARGRRSPSPLNPDVFYGNGFLTDLQPDGSQHPLRPATFDVSNICAPDPTNIWAAIKANHGVQLSSEFIGATLEQFNFEVGSDMIDIGAQLDKIGANPSEWIICIRDGDRGHCVQPLRIIETVLDPFGAVIPGRKQIEVWDNNRPDQTRLIDIELTTNRYSYADLGWDGNWLLVYRVDPIYDNNRHVPSIDTAGYALGRFGVTHLWDLLQMIVSGDAEPLVTAGDNTQTGWTAAGDFVANSEQTVAIPNFNWIPDDVPPLGHHPMSMHHRTDLGAPSMEIYNRGKDYKLHSSHHGTMFQMFVGDGAAGESDHLTYTESGGRVLGAIFEAGLGGRDVETRIALCKNADEYPAAVSVGSIRVLEGTKIGIETIPDGSGFHFRNDTGGEIKPSFNIVAATTGIAPDFFDTEPLPLPDASTLTVSSPDGTNFSDLVFAIDHDRDGAPDESWQFLSSTSEFVPYVAPPEPSLDLKIAGPFVVIIHPDGLPDWGIEQSENLADDWNFLDTSELQIEVIDGLVYTYLQRANRGFFRYSPKKKK